MSNLGPRLVLVGPGCVSTLPGLFTEALANLLRDRTLVDRVALDANLDGVVGLDRAMSPAVDEEQLATTVATLLQGRQGVRRPVHGVAGMRGAHSDLEGASTLVLVVWPSLGKGWLRAAFDLWKRTNVPLHTLWCSVPSSTSALRHGRLAGAVLARSTSVLTGSDADAAGLANLARRRLPPVVVHPGLSMRRACTGDIIDVLAFVPGLDRLALSSVVAGFDSISSAVIEQYRLRLVVSPYALAEARALRRSAHHSTAIEVLPIPGGESEIRALARRASVVVASDTMANGPAVAGAVSAGVGLVLLSSGSSPAARPAYVGAVVADPSNPASVHVGITHCARRRTVRFPSSEELESLSDTVTDVVGAQATATRLRGRGRGQRPGEREDFPAPAGCV